MTKDELARAGSWDAEGKWWPDPVKDDLARKVAKLPGYVWREGVYWIGKDGGPGNEDCEGRIGVTAETPLCLRSYNDVRPVLDDAATGGVLLAMVLPEHRHRAAWDWGSGCYVAALMDGVVKADSLGHAAAMVLVDCGRCHVGS